MNRTEHKLSYRGLELQKILSVYIRDPPHTAIRMYPKKPKQNLGADPPHPIHQYSSGNINTLHIHMHTCSKIFHESQNQKFHQSHRQIISYIAGETLLTLNRV